LSQVGHLGRVFKPDAAVNVNGVPLLQFEADPPILAAKRLRALHRLAEYRSLQRRADSHAPFIFEMQSPLARRRIPSRRDTALVVGRLGRGEGEPHGRWTHFFNECLIYSALLHVPIGAGNIGQVSHH
jgi:hypothetical protein